MNEIEELLPIWCEGGQDSGQANNKQAVHQKGQWHPTVQVWLQRQKSPSATEWLLQLRSKEKDNYPNCWDISAAGHVRAGETIIQAARRELHEELGLSLTAESFRFLFRMPYFGHYANGLIDYEWQHNYLVDVSDHEAGADSPSAFTLQSDEVTALRWCSLQELQQEWAAFVENPARERPWQGHKARGFAPHRHYPSESNAQQQQPPKAKLEQNYYWSTLLNALKESQLRPT